MVLRNPVIVEEGPCRMYTAMSSAVSEWFLMLLLFINGVISYFITRFARYCKLRAPCLFCSRLDHLLGSEKLGFYKNLICDAHKLEISSLAYCHVHRRLADVREMCEACLLSFASEKKLNVESYRSLIRKMETNLNIEEPGMKKLPEIVEKDGSKDKACGEGIQIPKLKDDALDFLRKRHCSCCHRRFRMKSLAHRLLQTTSIGAEIAETKGVASGLTGCDCIEPRDLVTKRKENRGSHGLDCLSHVGYSELKLYSDSESEVPPSDDDGGSVRSTNMKTLSLQDPAISDDKIVSKAPSGELALEKLIHPSLVESAAGVAVEKQVCEIAPPSVARPASNAILSHGLEELNWNEGKLQATPSKSDTISDVAPSESTDAKLDVVEIGDVPCISSSTLKEVPKTLVSATTDLKPLNINNDPTPLMPANMDLNDAYKLAIAGRGIEPAPSPRDPYRAQEDLRLLLFQLSSARGLELPANETTPSPRICRICEEAKPSDRSGPTGLQSVTKRFSIERNESGFSSLDESVFCEIEGESTVDRLKRLIEFERKSLILLYKELEEERSASAIAANQAMAMITRLQAEKAAMQMEALQYQRMMEEQAEYDQEALQRSNDFLAQKEREIQELESEIDVYRRRFVEDYKDGGVGSEEEKATAGKIFMSFEDEKIYISKCLKKLEKKLRLYSTKGLFAARSESGEDGKPDDVLENGHCNSLENDQTGRNASSKKDIFPMRNSHSKSKEVPKTAVTENGKGNSSLPKSDIEKKQSVFVERDKDIMSTVGMVSQLNERLEALEADKNFLEHTINALKKGNEGLQFIQEIASHLQDLRKVMAGREQVVT